MRTTLSDLLHSLRAGGTDAAFMELGHDTGVRLAANGGAFVHLLIAGEAMVEAAAADGAIRLATPGDYAVMLGGRPHVLATAARTEPQSSDYFRSRHDHDGPPTLRFGSGRVGARLLSGHLRIDGSHPLVRALPRLIAVTGEAHAAGGLLRPEAVNGLQGPGGSALVAALFDLLLVQAARAAGGPIFAGGTQRPAAPLRIPRALALVDADLKRRWTLDLLAAEVGASRSTFAAEFMRHVGQPPMAYIAAQRMERAAASLRGTPLPVTEVAWQVGYASPSAFARSFHRQFGTSPAAYRAGGAATRNHRPHHHLHWSAFLDES